MPGLCCLAVLPGCTAWPYCSTTLLSRTARPHCLAVLLSSHRQRRKVSGKLHFSGLNVGKVAKLRKSLKPRTSENSLTCMFTKAEMVCDNELQLFRHLSLRNTGFRLRGAVGGPKCRWNGNASAGSGSAALPLGRNVARTGIRRPPRWLARFRNALTCAFAVLQMGAYNAFPF